MIIERPVRNLLERLGGSPFLRKLARKTMVSGALAVGLVAAVAGSFAADVSAEDATKQEYALFEGTWRVTSLELFPGLILSVVRTLIGKFLGGLAELPAVRSISDDLLFIYDPQELVASRLPAWKVPPVVVGHVDRWMSPMAMVRPPTARVLSDIGTTTC